MSWAKYKRLSSSKDLSIFRRGTTASDGGGNDPDAQAYIDALGSAGYTVSGAEETAINNHFLDLKGTGPNNSTYDWWTGCVRLLPFIGTNAAQQGIEGQNPASSINFYGGMIFSSIGAEGNGTNAYFDFFAPNELPPDDNSVWIYSSKVLATSRGFYDGSSVETIGDVTYRSRYLLGYDNTNSRMIIYYGSENMFFYSPVNSSPTQGGFFGTTKYNASTCDLYLNGNKYQASLGAGVYATTQTVPALAQKFSSGFITAYSPYAYGYALITTGVSTTTEEAALRACVEAFMTALNREV